jgi:hypothetical protein
LARAVFAIYVFLTIPVLAFLLFLLATRMPFIFTTIWDSLLNQMTNLSAAWSESDVSGVAASVSQMLMLALELLGIAYLSYTVGRVLVKALWSWGKPTPVRRVVSALVSASIVAGLGLLWVPELPSDLSFFSGGAPDGTQSFEVSGRSHVETPVSYPQTPPVGGDHASVWQNCGFYDTPIADENAVHSLEHGAVWISYQPDLAEEQIESLRRFAQRQNYVLTSPYPDLPSPIVVSAWGRQLRLDSADDSRLNQFVRVFRFGQQAPERVEPCTGGTGTPE